MGCIICRAINSRRGIRNKNVSLAKQQFPPLGKCFRGGGFDDRFRPFFSEKKRIRVPGFLATSGSLEVARSFAFTIPEDRPRVLWTIDLDPRGRTDLRYRVKNMTFVLKSLIADEG